MTLEILADEVVNYLQKLPIPIRESANIVLHGKD